MPSYTDAAMRRSSFVYTAVAVLVVLIMGVSTVRHYLNASPGVALGCTSGSLSRASGCPTLLDAREAAR